MLKWPGIGIREYTGFEVDGISKELILGTSPVLDESLLDWVILQQCLINVTIII